VELFHLGRFLRKDDIKNLRAIVDESMGLGGSLLPNGSRVEGFSAKKGEVFAVNNQPSFYVGEDGTMFPLLVFVLKSGLPLPRITVDMKAVPHICNGADVFRGGVRNIDANIKAKQMVIVADEKNLKPICIGKSLVDAKTMQEMTQGKVIQNMHYVGDSIWGISKGLETLQSHDV
jgi:PUA domain protein